MHGSGLDLNNPMVKMHLLRQMGKIEHGLHFKCSYDIILDIITVLKKKRVLIGQRYTLEYLWVK